MGLFISPDWISDLSGNRVIENIHQSHLRAKINKLLKIKKKKILSSTCHKINMRKHLYTPHLPFNINSLIVQMIFHLYINTYNPVLLLRLDIYVPWRWAFWTKTFWKKFPYINATTHCCEWQNFSITSLL